MIIPEGFLVHLSEIRQLIKEIDQVVDKQQDKSSFTDRLLNEKGFVKTQLSRISAAVFKSLPRFTQKEFLLERESSGHI